MKKWGSARKEAAILCNHESTVAKNVVLLRVSETTRLM